VNFARLLHTGDSPARTAFAFAVGVFFAFSPLVGLHTVLGLIVAVVLNQNRVAVLAGVYTNLPWFFAPYYGLTTAIAATLMGVGLRPDTADEFGATFDFSPLQAEFWAALGMFTPLVWPFLIGSTAGALLLAFVAYRLSLAYLLARRHTAEDPVREGL
jgi:uncharacterized protein (DUF2062 family)